MEYLKMVIKVALWAITHMDLFLGCMSLLAFLLSIAKGEISGSIVCAGVAVIGFGLYFWRKKRGQKKQNDQ